VKYRSISTTGKPRFLQLAIDAGGIGRLRGGDDQAVDAAGHQH
jgi:hypothetical protein